MKPFQYANTKKSTPGVNKDDGKKNNRNQCIDTGVKVVGRGKKNASNQNKVSY